MSVFYLIRMYIHRMLVLPPMFIVAFVFVFCAAWDKILAFVLQVAPQID